MTATDRRDGPTLRVVGTCDGCAHLIPGGERPPRCVAMNGKMMPSTSPAPAWCPEMSRARLALARSVVSPVVAEVLDVDVVALCGYAAPPVDHARMIVLEILNARATYPSDRAQIVEIGAVCVRALEGEAVKKAGKQ